MKKLKNILKSTPGKIIAIIAVLIIVYLFAASYEREKAISSIIANMKADAGWLSSIESKAEAAGISIDEQMRQDAKWILQNADDYLNKWWNF